MGFWAALQFLTIFPTPIRHEVATKASGQSLTYFPLVGLILGAILLGLHYGLTLVLPASVVNALLILTASLTPATALLLANLRRKDWR